MADHIFEPEVRKSLDVLYWKDIPNIPPLAIECKRTQAAYLPFANVQEHQIKELLRFELRGVAMKVAVPSAPGNVRRRFQLSTGFDFLYCTRGLGYLLVNFRFTKKAPRKDISKGTNRCFGVRANAYVDVVAKFREEGKASVPYEWFVENAIECPRIRIEDPDSGNHSYGWDLEPLVTNEMT